MKHIEYWLSVERLRAENIFQKDTYMHVHKGILHIYIYKHTKNICKIIIHVFIYKNICKIVSFVGGNVSHFPLVTVKNVP